MADRATVLTAPAKDRKVGKGEPEPEKLTVRVAGVTFDAVTIKDAKYQPAQGDDVTTIPLANGTALLLGPA